ncbi:helix-turn-helix domain-containing protein [Neobacillus sp. MER 74]|uniref:helix-turn-helix domain-containing protein n=1 Tax=unclassified Neobacillus TaxID=2675272 RepID=UPI00203B414E|nr:helix-turn-helix domain-containing protein [Neobacillus sp. MER 74]MCM3114386.1 helix-turn-helix domain-containing protein [Neobacillus sp. MER 74]
MLRKLLSIYENSILFPDQPITHSEQLYVFFSEMEKEWIGIPKSEVTEKELTLLQTIYQLVENPSSVQSSVTQGWDAYLLEDGPPPSYHAETNLRFIQFQINGDDTNQFEIESALKGFFTEGVIIIWENKRRGIIIEEATIVSLTEEELISMSETLESDFYVKIAFFVGKFNSFHDQLRSKFLLEKEFFSFGLINLVSLMNIFTYERVLPAYVAYHLPMDLKPKIHQGIFEVFNDEPEMYSTIKVFLENNLNASLTAKKLYIHRNTLQYRIDKFIDKSGIQLKDFYGAFTVFLACLLFEQSQKR